MSAQAVFPDPSPEVAGVLDCCEGVEQTGPTQWRSRCPVPEHGGDGDDRPSFAITEGQERPVVVECLGGCSYQDDVVPALLAAGAPREALGTSQRAFRRTTSRRTPKPNKRKSERPRVLEDQDKPYGWHDRLADRADEDEGSPEGQAWAFLTERRGLSPLTIERYHLGWDGSHVTLPVRVKGKFVNVRRYRIDGPADEPKMQHLRGYGKGATLYPLENLRGNTLPVLVCEGEFDALLAQQSADGAFAAVTGTGGAATPPKDLTPLRDRDVVIAYDADEAGGKGAAKLAAALTGVARKVAVLDLTRLGIPPNSKEDVSDYILHRGGTGAALAQEMSRLLTGARERFELVFANDLAQPVPPMRWLVRGVWPAGSYGVLGGEKKTLKTYNALALALAVASGEPFLGHFPVPDVGNVLYLLGEGGRAPTQRRVQRIAATMGVSLPDLGQRLAMSYDAAPADGPLFTESVERALDTVQPDLVVLDPLYAFHPPGVEAQNLYDRGQMLSELRDLLGHDAALVVADHFRKTGGKELDLDSIAQAGMSQWADSWMLQCHREDPAVDSGEFRLSVEFGSRQWGGARFAVDWSLGSFDPDTGEHVGQLAWEVHTAEWASVGRGRQKESHEERLMKHLQRHPFEHSRSEVLKAVRGAEKALAEALDVMVEAGTVSSETRHVPRSNGATYPKKTYGPVRRLSMSRSGRGEKA